MKTHTHTHTKKVVKFGKNLLFFQQFMQIFVFAQISGYYHLNYRNARLLHSLWYEYFFIISAPDQKVWQS